MAHPGRSVQCEIVVRMIELPDHSWGRIELRHLAALDAVAETGSFRAAARLLGYSQSAVSEQVAALEGLTGQRLVERSRGRGAITVLPAGHVLLTHAQSIADRLTAARSDLEDLRANRPRVRLGVFQSAAVSLLPGLLAKLEQAPGRLLLEIVERPDDEALLALLRHGEIDVTFVVLPLTRGPFAHRELISDPYRLLVPAGSPLAERAQVLIEELRPLPFIDYRDLRLAHHTVRKLPPGRRPRLVARSDDNTVIHALVAAGVGVAILPGLGIDRNNPRVRAVPLDPPLPDRRLALAWHRDRTIPWLDQVLDLAQRTAAEVAAALAG